MADSRFYQNNGPFTLLKIAEIIGAELKDGAHGQDLISDIKTMDNAGAEDICFFYDKKIKEKASAIKAKACVTTAALADFLPSNVVVLIHPNPKIAFLKLNSAMYQEYTPLPAISPKASIHPSAKSVKIASLQILRLLKKMLKSAITP